MLAFFLGKESLFQFLEEKVDYLISFHHWGAGLTFRILQTVSRYRLGLFGETAPSRGRSTCAPGGADPGHFRSFALLPSQGPGWLGGGAKLIVYPLLTLTTTENKAAWLWGQQITAGGGRHKGWHQ